MTPRVPSTTSHTPFRSGRDQFSGQKASCDLPHVKTRGEEGGGRRKRASQGQRLQEAEGGVEGPEEGGERVAHQEDYPAGGEAGKVSGWVLFGVSKYFSFFFSLLSNDF